MKKVIYINKETKALISLDDYLILTDNQKKQFEIFKNNLTHSPTNNKASKPND